MSTSLIELNGKSFWCFDSVLEIFAWLLADELVGIASMSSYERHLRIQATAGLTGCISLSLDSLPPSAHPMIELAIGRVVERCERDAEILSASALTRLRLGGGATFSKAVDPRFVRALARSLIDLLRGDWAWSGAPPDQWLES